MNVETRRVRALLQLGYMVNAALAAAVPVVISKKTVYDEASRDQLFDYIEQQLRAGADIFIQADDRRELNAAFGRIANAVVPEDFGLSDSTPGLALVMAFILEELKILVGQY